MANNTNIRIIPAMNTNTVQGLPTAQCFSNGGDYVTEGMPGSQQLSACALTQAA